MKKQKTDYKKIALDGILYNNPVFVQLLGMCSTLAITTTVFNGIGMGPHLSAFLSRLLSLTA